MKKGELFRKDVELALEYLDYLESDLKFYRRQYYNKYELSAKQKKWIQHVRKILMKILEKEELIS